MALIAAPVPPLATDKTVPDQLALLTVIVLPSAPAVTPVAGTAAAVIDVLQPNPVLVVQIKASAAAEQLDTACAVGLAEPDVALTRTVFVACVARSASVMRPVAVTELVKVGLAIDGLVENTRFVLVVPVVPAAENPVMLLKQVVRLSALRVCSLPRSVML